jgi:hypothetical protein
MHLASPTGPAHAEVSSAIKKMSFSAARLTYGTACRCGAILSGFISRAAFHLLVRR